MTTDPKKLYLSKLRDKESELTAFRLATHQLTHLLAYEAIAHMATSDYNLETPTERATGARITYPITLVPILRSGLAMLPVFLEYFPEATIGLLGLQRNKQQDIVEEYFCNIPALSNDHRVIILDPMIATGQTVSTAVDIISKSIPTSQILIVSIIGATPGIDAIKKTYPEIRLIIGDQDTHLNDKKFIIPGLGDFGDRYFGTTE